MRRGRRRKTRTTTTTTLHTTSFLQFTPLSYVSHQVTVGNWRPPKPPKSDFDVPASIWQTILACWDSDDEHRPSIDKVLEHLETVSKIEILSDSSRTSQFSVNMKEDMGLMTHKTSRDKKQGNASRVAGWLADVSAGDAKAEALVKHLMEDMIKPDFTGIFEEVVEGMWELKKFEREDSEYKKGVNK